MAPAYTPLDEGDKPADIRRQSTVVEKRYRHTHSKPSESKLITHSINTVSRSAIYGSILLLIIVACIAFWGVSRDVPMLLSHGAEHTVEENAKAMTFVWTLIGVSNLSCTRFANSEQTPLPEPQ